MTQDEKLDTKGKLIQQLVKNMKEVDEIFRRVDNRLEAMERFITSLSKEKHDVN